MDKILSAAKEYLDDDRQQQQQQQQQHHQPSQQQGSSYGQQRNSQHQSSEYGQQQQGNYGQDQYDQQQQSGSGSHGQDRYEQQQSGGGGGFDQSSGGRYEQEGQQHQQNPSAGGSRPAGGLASFLGNLDFDSAKNEAAKNAGSSGDKDMFSNILNLVGQKQNKIAEEDVDEEDAVRKHQKTYNDEDHSGDSKSLGTAAAMQALKMLNQGDAGSGKSANSQSAFLGLAMSEASKLFDNKASQGKVDSNASKEGTIQSAAEMALKMYMKSQGQGQSSGGLMAFASKFM